MVHNGTTDEIAWDLNMLFLSSAVVNTIILTLIVVFFTARPPVPPSLAQLTAQEEKAFDSNFWSTLAGLMTNKDFILLFITYGESGTKEMPLICVVRPLNSRRKCRK